MPEIHTLTGQFKFPLYLAPMAGFSDMAFRSLCKREGADMLVSEFVMANAVLAAGDKSRIWDTLAFLPEQRPYGVQLFGAEPSLMAEAARKLADRLVPDFIDINCGCPAPKIVDQNAGSALLKDLPLMASVARAVVRAVPELPVTVKMRSGWDQAHIVAPEAARMLESEGVAAIAVHGRTRMQGYGGDADWNLIAEVAHAVRIPVIGNGAVNGAYNIDIAKASGVSGLMIGRAALGKPWIFRQLKAALAGAPCPPEPDAALKLHTMLDYARALLGSGEDIRKIRPKLKPFTEGIAGARKLRAQMDALSSLPELEDYVANLLHDSPERSENG